MNYFTFPIRVYYEDTDAGGVVYYANYLKFIERARTEWLRTLGFEQTRLSREQGVVFAVRSVTAEYLRPARLDDELCVISRIASMGRAQIVFEQQVERKASMEDNSDILVTATVRVASIAVERMRPMAMPREIYEKLKAIT